MGLPSVNFARHEFECHCGKKCGCDTVDAELLAVLDAIRACFNAKVIVRSGHRCKAHNAAVGGAEGSQHLCGKAADISVDGVPHETVADWLANTYRGRYGLGRYPWGVHIDVRETNTQWVTK
jgi:uncharacterized protein YcbK (DUF882 family)